MTPTAGRVRTLVPVIEILRRILAKRLAPLSPRASRRLLLGASLGIGILALISWRSAEVSFARLNWWALVAALGLAAPASLLLRALEFDASARILGHRPSASRSFRVALAASVANLLPLPGSLIVNVRSLSQHSTYGSAIGASAVPGIVWVGLVSVIGGVAIMVNDNGIVGAVLALGGLAVLSGGWLLFIRTEESDGRLAVAGRILLVEFSYLVISVVRLSLALAALRVSASLDQVVALSVAGALATAVGFFPAGLGVREVFVGALAPLVGLPFSVGVLVGVADRLVWLTFLAVIILMAGLRRAQPAEG